MSTIVGVEKAGRVAVAYDSMRSVGRERCVNAASPSKVVRAGSCLVGCAGLTLYWNILEDYLSRTKQPVLGDDRAVFRFFLEFWRSLHKRYHMVNDQSDTDAPSPFADLDAEFLVAAPSGLFVVKQILSVSRFERFCAIGSGAPHAEGALYVLYDAGRTAAEIAEKALSAALAFDAASGGPVRVEEVVARKPNGGRRGPTVRRRR